MIVMRALRKETRCKMEIKVNAWYWTHSPVSTLRSVVMFVVLLRVYLHTGQAEKYAWPRWESNLGPLEC